MIGNLLIDSKSMLLYSLSQLQLVLCPLNLPCSLVRLHFVNSGSWGGYSGAVIDSYVGWKLGGCRKQSGNMLCLAIIAWYSGSFHNYTAIVLLHWCSSLPKRTKLALCCRPWQILSLFISYRLTRDITSLNVSFPLSFASLTGIWPLHLLITLSRYGTLMALLWRKL